jgi:hypothetical protein
MQKIKSIALVLCAVSVLSACSSVSSSDKEFLREISAVGISPEDQQVKNPILAGGLNVLPGFGNFYLAMGTSEDSQWLYGTLNLLFWPLSVTWGIPEAAIDAKTINKKATAYYYQYDPDGKDKLAQARAQSGTAVFGSRWKQPSQKFSQQSAQQRGQQQTQHNFGQQPQQFARGFSAAVEQPDQFNRHSLVATDQNQHLATGNINRASQHFFGNAPAQSIGQQPSFRTNNILAPAMLPVFAGTSVNSQVLYFVQPNATVNVAAKMQNGWVKVAGTSRNSPSGYMHTGWIMQSPENLPMYSSTDRRNQVSLFSKGTEGVIFLVENKPGWYKLRDRNSAGYNEVFVHIPSLAGAEAI